MVALKVCKSIRKESKMVIKPAFIYLLRFRCVAPLYVLIAIWQEERATTSTSATVLVPGFVALITTQI
jgi:hypothetical protein